MTNEDFETNPRGTMERLLIVSACYAECQTLIGHLKILLKELDERLDKIEGSQDAI